MQLAARDATVLLIAPARFTTAPRFRCFSREMQKHRLIIRSPSFIREVPNSLNRIESVILNQFQRGALSYVRWIQAVTQQSDHVDSGADESLLKIVRTLIRDLEAQNVIVEDPIIFDPYQNMSSAVEEVAKAIRDALPALPQLRDLKDARTPIPLEDAAEIAGQWRGRPYSVRRLQQIRKNGGFSQARTASGQDAIIGHELYLKFGVR